MQLLEKVLKAMLDSIEEVLSERCPFRGFRIAAELKRHQETETS